MEPIKILNADPEHSAYLLLATYNAEDNMGYSLKEWIPFDTRKGLYEHIKDNLSSGDVLIDIPMIDLKNSYVLIEGEPYNPNNMRTAFIFMSIARGVYNDDFNPNDYIIRDDE